MNLDGFDMNELMEQILFVGGVSSSIKLLNLHALLRDRGFDICMQSCAVSFKDPSDPEAKSIGMDAKCIVWREKVYGVDGVNTRKEIEQGLIEDLMETCLRRGANPERFEVQWQPCEHTKALPSVQPGLERVTEVVDRSLAEYEQAFLDKSVPGACGGRKKIGPRL